MCYLPYHKDHFNRAVFKVVLFMKVPCDKGLSKNECTISTRYFFKRNIFLKLHARHLVELNC